MLTKNITHLPVTENTFYVLQDKCLAHMSSNGIPFEGPIIADGKPQRFSIDAKKNKKDEWYIAWQDLFDGREYLNCVYSSYSSSKAPDKPYLFLSWEKDDQFDKDDRVRLHQIADKNKKEANRLIKVEQDKVAIEAKEIWDASSKTPPTDSHNRYCSIKKIPYTGARFGSKERSTKSGEVYQAPFMIIPMYNIKGELRSLQYISINNDGSSFKQFIKGGEKKGCFHVFGKLEDGKPIGISEGYATGMVCYQSLVESEAIQNGGAVIVAFDCINLDPVTRAIRKEYPKSPITIFGDDDLGKEVNPGRTHAKSVAAKYQCETIFPTFPEGKERGSDGKYYTDFNDLALVAGLDEVANILNKDGKIHKPVKKDTGWHLLESLNKNEIGDAEIFCEFFKDKYLFDPTEGKNGDYYLWNRNYWELDQHKERYNDFDQVSNAYLVASKEDNIDEGIQKDLQKRTAQLRTDRRRRSVLETVSSKLSFRGKWDHIPGLLPCANGVLDLREGSFSDPKREQYIRKTSPVKYNPTATCPKFMSFLNDISLGDKEWVEFLQRCIGYAVLGIPKEEILIYFYGEEGRNGKGTLVKMLQHCLGHLSKTFPSEMLLLQRNLPSSGSASPELANFEGVRLAFFSEINQGKKIDSAKVKNLSGRDTISCRRLYSNKDLQIDPLFTIFIQTNYKPKAPAEDNALWDRTIMMPFKARFVRDPKQEHEKPLNENFKEELMAESEGILLWIVEGCLEYQAKGLQIPDSIKQETENYRKENDGVGQFLKDCCSVDEPQEVTTSKTEMKIAIKHYCEANGFEIPNGREISLYLEKNGFKEKRVTMGMVWQGIRID